MAGVGPGRVSLTSPGVMRASARRPVSAADFDSDPIYSLEPDPTPGSWRVAALGAVIGRVTRPAGALEAAHRHRYPDRLEGVRFPG